MKPLKKYRLLPEDWEYIERVCKVMKIFYDASQTVCSDKEPTIHYSIVVFDYLKCSITDLIHSLERSTETGEDLILGGLKKARQKIEEYYNKSLNSFYLISLILNPNRKLDYLETGLLWSLEKIRNAKNTFTDAYISYQEMFPSQVDSDASESGNTFDTYKKASHSNTTEVETYLSSRPENLGMTILKWWYANSESYPILSMMARDYLSVPATSASSERIFSGGVDLVTPNRCRA